MTGSPVAWLPRLVGRVPATIHMKLLVAFLSMVALLVSVGAASLEALSGANRRAEDLVKLQRKMAAYHQLRDDMTAQLYRVTSALLVPGDSGLEATLRQLNQFGYDFDRLQFVAKDEVELLAELRKEDDEFIRLVSRVSDLIRQGKGKEGLALQVAEVVPLSERMERLTNQLVNRAEADMVASNQADQAAHRSAQWLIIGFGLGSIALALALGYSISVSVIEPVKQIENRLNEIALGNFSQRIKVANRDELGNLAANLNQMSDELGRLYRELEAANLAKSRFLAAASHDLREPLHALNLFIGQLRNVRDPLEQARISERIDLAVSAMNELFNALLDISRLDAGVLAPDVTEFPVARLLQRIEATFASSAREKGLRLRVVPSRTWIRSDFILVERILLNLVANAIRYTGRGGVVVGCRRRGGELRIEVWDTGVGIPEDQRENIFAEFYQVGASRKDSRGGLGLGLAIVDRLCRLLDHRLDLTTRVGKGSCFAISVPSVEASHKAVAARIMDRAPADPEEGKRIVVIDDDSLVLDAMSGLLQSWGCQVVAVESLGGALSALAGRSPPDLVISDFRLSGGQTGIDAIRRLRGEFGIPIPAFLITGDIAPECLLEARVSGLHLLHKPIGPMVLRAILSQLLRSGVAPTSPHVRETSPAPSPQ